MKQEIQIDFSKSEDKLVPAIIQDSSSNRVLMLGYMNEESLDKTCREKVVTFYSRSKKRLWTKGETSGNYLSVVEIKADCDQDSILIKVDPCGPVCHSGADTCWSESNEEDILVRLEKTIARRRSELDGKSYTASLFNEGLNRIAQKVGEEAVETVIEALGENDEKFLGESADLLFHFLVLLNKKGFSLKDVKKVLENRSKR